MSATTRRSARDSVGSAAVVATDVRRSFAGRPVLRGLDLQLAPGEFVALLGRSGSGKTTLLRGLAGLDTGVEGSLLVPAARSVVFQSPRLLPWKRVLANVMIGRRRGVTAARAREALDEVGLGSHARAWPVTLSGGEAQRVALARALVREPALLLLDEPFGALDALTRIKMHVLLRELWQRRRPAVLLVTHDVDEALLLADRVIVLTDGVLSYYERLDASQPRHRDDPELVVRRRELLAELGVPA